MSKKQPEHTRQADQQNRDTIRNEDDVDQVLCDSETDDGEPEREGGDCDNHQANLPGLIQNGQTKQRTELRNKDTDEEPSHQYHKDTGPPGAEAGEKAPEWTYGLGRPDVDRAFVGEHLAKLSRDDGARNEESQVPQ